jgi:hypothetical protein
MDGRLMQRKSTVNFRYQVAEKQGQPDWFFAELQQLKNSR